MILILSEETVARQQNNVLYEVNSYQIKCKRLDWETCEGEVKKK